MNTYTKQDCLNNIKRMRKKYGNNSKEVYKAIYRVVKLFPYYEGYDKDWFSNNSHYL